MCGNLERLTPQTPHALQTLSISSLCQIMQTNKGKEMAEFYTFWVALETFFATTCEVWVAPLANCIDLQENVISCPALM